MSNTTFSILHSLVSADPPRASLTGRSWAAAKQEGLFYVAAQSPKWALTQHPSYVQYTLFNRGKYSDGTLALISHPSSFFFFFVAATGGITLIWPWVPSSYITLQRLQPLKQFHVFNFLFPWLNLELYLWKKACLSYPNLSWIIRTACWSFFIISFIFLTKTSHATE